MITKNDAFFKENKAITDKLTYFLLGLDKIQKNQYSRVINVMLNARERCDFLNIDNLSSKILYFWQKNMPVYVYEKIIYYNIDMHCLTINLQEVYKLTKTELRLKDRSYVDAGKPQLKIFPNTLDVKKLAEAIEDRVTLKNKIQKTIPDIKISKPENVEFKYKNNPYCYYSVAKLVKATDLINKQLVQSYKDKSEKESIMSITKNSVNET